MTLTSKNQQDFSNTQHEYQYFVELNIYVDMLILATFILL